MTLVFRKLWRGVVFVQQGIFFLMGHPVLFLYALPPLLVSLITMSILEHPSKGFMDVSKTMLIILVIIQALLQTVTFICLAYHVMCILNQEVFSLKHVLTARLLCNTLFIFIIVISAYFVWANGQPYFFYSSAVNCILLPLWLTMPMVTTESISLIQALKRSRHLIWRYFAIFMGILITLVILNKVLRHLIYLMITPLTNAYQILISSSLLLQLSNPMLVLTIITVTIFYYEYYARPKPELMDIFSPDI